ncbi:hypothetical protein [Polaromonas sp. A23]|uniref:hypothetical protein n=1 Tax=Polaromonas sp. A23 TaxID=1944133 RepID=UPI0009870CA3|nr:hypothetical protein [Polaromonas sp. A23]OOG39469.1 hypothetical protein B0B52_15780 [Polaromonas sp. A23]
MIARKFFLWTGVAIAIAASFAAGLRTGVMVGAEQWLKMDSSAKASVLTSELRALRAGNVGEIIEMKEMEVDSNVVSAIEFQKSGMPWLFWPNAGVWNHTRSLEYVAQYRKQYPAVASKLAPPEGTPDPGDLRGFAMDVEFSTKELLERYGK